MNKCFIFSVLATKNYFYIIILIDVWLHIYDLYKVGRGCTYVAGHFATNSLYFIISLVLTNIAYVMCIIYLYLDCISIIDH